VPGLIWGKWEDEPAYRWHIGLFERENLKEGWLLRSSELEIYTYQLDQLLELGDAMLEYDGLRFRFVDALDEE